MVRMRKRDDHLILQAFVRSYAMHHAVLIDQRCVSPFAGCLCGAGRFSWPLSLRSTPKNVTQTQGYSNAQSHTGDPACQSCWNQGPYSSVILSQKLEQLSVFAAIRGPFLNAQPSTRYWKDLAAQASWNILKLLFASICSVSRYAYSIIIYSFFSSGLWRLKWWIIMDYLWLFVIFYPTCSTTSPESKDCKGCAPWAQIQWSELFASLYIHLHAADRPEEPSDVQKHI